MARIETDYLVVGAGAVGMAFTDALVAHSDADVVLVDRRHRPGGHWHDAYPFVRLHVPSAYYGVSSLPLGRDRVDTAGPNAGRYELASADEIRAYFDAVLDEVLLPTGRVRFLGMHEYVMGAGGPRLVDLLTGEEVGVTVRRAVVDATYLEGHVPARHAHSFTVAPEVRCVPVGALVEQAAPASGYVVMGAGKTGIDACLWLLDHGIPADRIRWVRPRDTWLYDRTRWQPLDQLGSTLEGLALELEALAGATSVDDLFRRLEAGGQLLRIDERVEPTMFRCATVSAYELERLRSIGGVVRLGHVRRIELDRIVLDEGEVATDPATVHVDCTAEGIRRTPPRPVFEAGLITVQPLRSCQPTFNAALTGYVEATRDDDAEKNRLCPPNPYPSTAHDWLRTFAASMAAAKAWNTAPDVQAWMAGSRLDLMHGLRERAAEPRVAAALGRYATALKPAAAALPRLLGELEPSIPSARPAPESTRAPA
ncbi:NAD(P)-binding protein [Blastococcus sp. SYSU D00922]